MVYCESCGAANETVTEKCFVCQQPFLDTEEQEVVLSRSSSDIESGNRSEDKHAPTLLQERYQIIKEVGTGGFGAVYKALDTKFDNHTVAIKEIQLHGLKPNEIIDATDTFNREVNILSDLRHPNLPRVYEHFTSPEHWYLVMDFIDGQTLEKYLDARGGRLPLDEIFMLGIQICTVLDYLHTRQPAIIFRDLKPTNIMITGSKQVYLIDFGAARYFKSGRTKDTIAFGSPGYAAPEQYGKAQTTARSDIYSLGATLHEALTGKDPAEDPFHFSPIRGTGQTIPPDLETLILRMVDMDMSKRPMSAAAVKAELWRISTQHTHRLYALPGSPSSMPPYRPTFGVGQPPPAAWAKSAPSVQQAQIQLGFTPTPAPRKRGISRRAVTTMAILGIASVAFLENARSLWVGRPDFMPGPQVPQPMAPSYSFRQLGAFTYHQDTVTSLGWSPQGNPIASGSLDKTLRIWNVDFDGTDVIHTMSDDVRAVGWLFDGSYVAAASGGKTGEVQVWSVQAKGGDQPALTFSKSSAGAINALAWVPAGQPAPYLAIASDDGNIRVIANATSSIKDGITATYGSYQGPVLSLAWSPDGNYLAGGSADKTVRIWPTNLNGSLSPNVPTVFSRHTGSVTALTWMGNSSSVISGGSDMNVLVWDSSGQVTQSYQTSSPVTALALSSQNLLAVGTEDGTVTLYNLDDPNAPTSSMQGSNSAIRSIAWSPDGRSFVVGGDDRRATLWNIVEDLWQDDGHRRHWGG
ncbi:MAG: serine/threonine protein kinase [Ktedonobacteraceae bacterium]|nr:serine/threonine protein kinase [Ktedonobacteraceae bacterium]